MSTFQVTALNARTTDTGAAYKDTPGVDVDVRVTMPGGQIVEGTVTLLPRTDGRSGYTWWGEADDWVSGNILSELEAWHNAEECTEALNEIETMAADYIHAVQS